MNTNLPVKGTIHLVSRTLDGTILKQFTQKNLVVNLGGVYTASRFAGSAGMLSRIAIGTGVTLPSLGDTTLETEVADDVNVSGPTQGSGDTAQTVTVSAVFLGDDWAGTVSELGLFYSTQLFSRAVLDTPFTLSTGKILEVHWTLSFAQAAGLVYREAFTNTDLSTGVLTVTHDLATQFPADVKIYDNDNEECLPDEITADDENTTIIDMHTYGAIPGTWHVTIRA